jgi:hypothetical protein
MLSKRWMAGALSAVMLFGFACDGKAEGDRDGVEIEGELDGEGGEGEGDD